MMALIFLLYTEEVISSQHHFENFVQASSVHHLGIAMPWSSSPHHHLGLTYFATPRHHLGPSRDENSKIIISDQAKMTTSICYLNPRGKPTNITSTQLASSWPYNLNMHLDPRREGNKHHPDPHVIFAPSGMLFTLARTSHDSLES
uniref:Uncharacterized protein n=1 Tax=Cannabis sativa TaxID=3483 RepID=A0A803PLJ7_CANSA